jgi:hypothetical protein
MNGGSAGSPWGGDDAGAQADGRNGPPDQDRGAKVKQIPEDRYGETETPIPASTTMITSQISRLIPF